MSSESHVAFNVTSMGIYSEDGDDLVFRAYTVKVFRREATAGVLKKMFCDEVACFQLIYVIYCLV